MDVEKERKLPNLRLDDDHDDHYEHDEHDDVTPDVPLPSTLPTPPEAPVESPSNKSKKMRQLTAEESDDMAEWLKDNPCIYKKKLDPYCQTDMKKRMWIEKAKELPNIDVKYLMNWYKSIRNHFGKLSRLYTGSGAPDLNKRDEGILCKFSWFKDPHQQTEGQAAQRIN